MTHYQICTQCVMDTTDPDLLFNNQGVCQYCETLKIHYENTIARTDMQIAADLQSAAALIKKRAGNAKYHCVLGMSGGVDSSFAADLVVNKMGLNPLIVHFDNGWNSSIAVENIKKIVTKLNIDMLTYVIDWDEFKDLQRAFLYASVLDIEMLTDNAIYGATLKIAKEQKIKCIVSGGNFTTESGLPNAWRWDKLDAKNIKAIHRQYGTRKLKSFPIYGPWKFIIDRSFRNFHYFSPLNIIHYNKTTAMQHLKNQFGWQYYGGKHYESVFTKFYQAYILPVKFGIDKRRAHLSSLIRNLEMTREDALLEMSKPPYDDLVLKQDIDYIQKKLELSADEFKKIMATCPKKHTDYPSDYNLFMKLKKLNSLINSMKK